MLLQDTVWCSFEQKLFAEGKASKRSTFCRDWATKSWKGKDHRLRSDSWGGGSLVIMKMTLMGFIVHFGGWDSAISMAVMPKAQTSTCTHNLHPRYQEHHHTSRPIIQMLIRSHILTPGQVYRRWPFSWTSLRHLWCGASARACVRKTA